MVITIDPDGVRVDRISNDAWVIGVRPVTRSGEQRVVITVQDDRRMLKVIPQDAINHGFTTCHAGIVQASVAGKSTIR